MMDEKRRDMLLGLLGLALLSLVLSMVLNRSLVRELTVKMGATMERLRSEAEYAMRKPPSRSRDLRGPTPSAITPGAPPILPLPEGGAPARALDPAHWIMGDDYPSEAIEREWEGIVSIAWTIEASGRAGQCYVLESSGHAALDEAACRLILLRGRFEPARDAEGRPISSIDQRQIVWRLDE